VKRIVGLGSRHQTYGEYSTEQLSDRIVGFLSVGSDPTSPSLVYKGTSGTLNEDAYLVAEDGDWVLMAVADAHYGPEASHALMERLDEHLGSIPHSLGELALLVLGLGHPPWPGTSATTFLVAVYNQETGHGFGYNWGDSSLCCLNAKGLQQLNEVDEEYISADGPMDIQKAKFEFQVEPGSLLLAYTDGINECHYRSPLTSVTERELRALYQRLPKDERALWFGQQLMELALAGVDGQPGGQDNVALVVVTVT
jgi:serine/threonine protein phosphatase PrpC